MPRIEKQLHVHREPAKPHPAATLMLLRDQVSSSGENFIEVLMTRRSMTASFAPGAYVFPGGMLDPEDGEVLGSSLLPVMHHESPAVEALAVAAIREAYEELGIVLAQTHGQLLDRQRPFLEQIKECGGQLFTESLVSFSQWVTDRDFARRFDVRFFVAHMPEGQTIIADEQEQFEPEWIRPTDGLARHERGEFNIIFPTIRTLRALARFPNVAAVLDSAQALSHEQLPVFCPRAGILLQQDARYLAEELPFGELEFVCPDGQIVHHLDWQHQNAVPLLKNVLRLTAPNASMMTGPGTNTYIIGEQGAYIVIDPGPNNKAHIERIAAIVGSGLLWILCTHSHPDHHPGAQPLSELTGAKIAGLPLGISEKTRALPRAWHFSPDHCISHGEQFTAGDTTIRAHLTPGHASNHVCFILEQDQALISGDHILSGVTPVIAPPDGNMGEYLRSLQSLLLEPVEFILPAHGYVMNDAKGAMHRLIAHRLKREAKVLAAFEKLQTGEPSSLVKLVYDDVDSRLHKLAQDSLLAHLIKLVEEKKVPTSMLPAHLQS